MEKTSFECDGCGVSVASRTRMVPDGWCEISIIQRRDYSAEMLPNMNAQSDAMVTMMEELHALPDGLPALERTHRLKEIMTTALHAAQHADVGIKPPRNERAMVCADCASGLRVVRVGGQPVNLTPELLMVLGQMR